MTVHQMFRPAGLAIPPVPASAVYHLLLITAEGDLIDGIDIDVDLVRDILALIAARRAGSLR